MKTKERLLEIAKEVQALNKDNLENLSLTGSLMLKHRGLRTLRESKDIDFVCEGVCEQVPGRPIVPEGFHFLDKEGCRSQINSIVFENEDGIKLDFMMSEREESDEVDGIRCASVLGTIKVKLSFARNDRNSESRTKHLDDVLYLLERNNVAITF